MANVFHYVFDSLVYKYMLVSFVANIKSSKYYGKIVECISDQAIDDEICREGSSQSLKAK